MSVGSKASLFLVLLLPLSACDWIRVRPPLEVETGLPGDSGQVELPALHQVDLGAVPVGARWSRRLPLDDLLATIAVDDPTLADTLVSCADLEPTGTSDLVSEASGDGRSLLVSWSPLSAGEASLELRIPDGRTFTVLAVALDSDAPLPSPLATTIAYEPLDSLAASLLGNAELAGPNPVPIGYDPVTGSAFVGDPDQGRAWRVDAFYNHATYGIWVAGSQSAKGAWTPAPDCFPSANYLMQIGECDGSERNSDDTIPDNWAYFHGGFAGDGELVGLTDLVADPDRGRMWVLGPEWVQGIDTDLFTTEDETTPYSFTQVLPGATSLGAAFQEPLGLVSDDVLVVVDRGTGSVGLLALPFDGQPPLSLADGDGAPSVAAVEDGVLVVASTLGVRAMEVEGGKERWRLPVPVGATEGRPIAAAMADGVAFVLYTDTLLVADDTGLRWHPLPAGEGVGLALDRVGGGDAVPLDLVYVVVADGEAGTLYAADLSGAWVGEAVALPSRPRGLGYGPQAHDLYVAYAAGAEGCHGELASACVDGVHPAIVHSLYNPYGLVPPVSRGQLLNLFLSPVIETPKDGDVNSDWTEDTVCAQEESALSQGCCALWYATEALLIPNAEYFETVIQGVGAETSEADDDPTLVWGVNPTWLRQARECLGSASAAEQQWGLDAIQFVADRVGRRSSLSAWTHTSVGTDDANGHQAWYMELQYEGGTDFQSPVDSQDEYQMLHDGMATVYTGQGLADASLADLDLWTPLTSGNHLDVDAMVDEVTGWPSPNWVGAVRDGPLSLGSEPRSLYYFMSAGGDPRIDADTFRKKELWPVDLRERPNARWLNEAVDLVGTEDPASGMTNLPGVSWEIGTILPVSETGAFRESLIYGQDVTDEHWELLTRYLRRLAASGDPDQVRTWYQHIFDTSNNYGDYAENSGVTDDTDVNVDGLERINTLLVAPGYARWALPEEIQIELDQLRSKQ
jgi:hypothetical protein